MEAQGPQGTPPGWYPNPQGPGQRYWNGNQWTGDVWEPKPESKFGTALQEMQEWWWEWWYVPLAAVLVIGAVGGTLQGLLSDSLSASEVDSVELGTTRAGVEEKLGSPAGTESSGIGGRECIFYDREGGAGRNQWQLCFSGSGEDARLEVKR